MYHKMYRHFVIGTLEDIQWLEPDCSIFASSLVSTTATFDLSSRYDFLACVDVEWWNYDSINLYF